MTDDQLVAHIELMESQSIGVGGDEIAAEQAKAMDYYNNRPFGNEEVNRSQLISSDVWDVVEGLTPLILKPFVSSDDLVKFAPFGPEDEEASEQESDYINYIVTQKNDVFESLIAWVKTGLLQKNGVVKYWWEKSKRNSIERYEGLSEDVLTLLAQEKNVTITEQAATQSADGTVSYNVVLRTTQEEGYAKYCVIPPEEFRISRDATSSNPKLANFVEHATYKTISEIREMGYDVEDNINDNSTTDPRISDQYIARGDNLNDQSLGFDTHGNDTSMREVLFREVFMYVDKDGDGIAELRKICIVGKTILADEETEEIPFCAWTPYPQAFKFHGKCPADETIEIQLAKSTLLRQTMENIYSINNNRVYVGPGVNLGDMIDNQIGGHIRITEGTVADNVREAAITPINGVTMPMMDYFDSSKENRTGFTRYNQGTDSNSLNKTATGIKIISEAGNERVGLCSRAFAELGLKQLMIGIHGLCRRHATKTDTIKLRGKWVEINPRDWKERRDMTVSVGLGTADKTMQMQGAQLLLDKQMALMPTGIVTPKNFYAAAAKLAQAVGEKNPDSYFTAPPDEAPEQPPPPDPMQDPAIMFQVAESKRKDGELDLKNKEFAFKQTEADRNFELRQMESQRAGLVEHARLHHDLVTLPESEAMGAETVEPAEPEEEKENEAVASLFENQKSMVAAFSAFMQQVAESNQLIAESLAAVRAPSTVRIVKQADGSMVGVKMPLEN
jgi:hypothetical protein